MISLISLLVYLLSANINTENTVTLTIIHLDGLSDKHIGKNLYVGYWHEHTENFPSDSDPEIGDVLTIATTDFSIKKQLLPDDYAFSMYIDMNGNGKLDKNLFGIPKEPYCFSQNVKPKLSAPKFNDCQFSLYEDAEMSIMIID